MEPLSHKLACALAIALLALPATAAANPVVPPENSAATQYTEAIPTGGGQKDAGKAGNRNKRSPSSVLGSHKAKKLESEGRTGREVAEVVAETAPSPTPEPEPATASKPKPQSAGERKSEAAGAGGSNQKGDPPGGASQAAPPAEPLDAPAGSSGLSEVLAQATGSSATGELGGLLPLILLATIVWALAYMWRQRQRTVQ